MSPSPEPHRWPFRIRLATAARLLLLQASWSPRAMQGWGLAWALEPALAELFGPDKVGLEAARRRIPRPFNTHPFLAAAVAGALLHLEARHLSQALPEGERSSKNSGLTRALQGPLAALGDGWYWLALRPLLGAVSVAAFLAFGPEAALVVVSIFGAQALRARWRGLQLGLQHGEKLVAVLSPIRLPLWSSRARHATVAVVAGLVVHGARLGLAEGRPRTVAWALGAFTVTVLLGRLGERLPVWGTWALAYLGAALAWALAS